MSLPLLTGARRDKAPETAKKEGAAVHYVPHGRPHRRQRPRHFTYTILIPRTARAAPTVASVAMRMVIWQALSPCLPQTPIRDPESQDGMTADQSPRHRPPSSSGNDHHPTVMLSATAPALCHRPGCAPLHLKRLLCCAVPVMLSAVCYGPAEGRI